MLYKKLAVTSLVMAGILLSGTSAIADGIAYGKANRPVTIWLVVINYPEACSSVPCTEADLFGAVPENPAKVAVCFMSGQIVRGDGKAVFAGRLGEGTSHGCFFPGDPNPFGLKDAMRAEIHAVAQEHGPALGGGAGREEQVAYFMGACNPTCLDSQFTIHVAADAMNGMSWAHIYRFADGSAVAGGRSKLIREKGGIRLTFDTRFDPPD